MCRARMVQRVPGARFVATGFLSQRRFVFHKRSEDGSAKADALFTGEDNDRIWGVVYRLPQEEKLQLDRFEFLGVGYDEHHVRVQTQAGSTIACTLYIARAEALDANLLPYQWYKSLILHGSREHNLPAEYIDTLGAFPAALDPNSDRRKRHLDLLRA